MKFSLIKNIVGLVALSSLALAKNCEQLKESDDYYVHQCKEDNGKVVELGVSVDDFNEKFYDEILSIESLKNLELYAPAQDNVTLSLEILTNLNQLDVSINSVDEFGYRDFHEYKITRGKFAKNGLKLPKNLKSLKLEGIVLSQDVVDDVADISLEDLELRYSTTNDLSFKKFADNKSISSLTVREMEANLYDGYLADNVVNNFKNIKKLTLAGVKLNNNIIKDVSNLDNLENLELSYTTQDHLDYTPLKKLSNLTSLYISPNTKGEEGDESAVRELDEYDEDILKSTSHLKKLELNDIKMSPDFVKTINTLSDLEELIIVPMDSYYDKKRMVIPFDISSFDNLNKLTSITLDALFISYEDENGNDIDYNGKFDLSKFKSLKKIYINHGITQEHIDQIATLKDLEELYLRGIGNESLNLDAVKTLPKLTVLEIDDEKIELPPKVPVSSTITTVTVTRTVPVVTTTAESTTTVDAVPTSAVETESVSATGNVPTSTTVDTEPTNATSNVPTSTVGTVPTTTKRKCFVKKPKTK